MISKLRASYSALKLHFKPRQKKVFPAPSLSNNSNAVSKKKPARGTSLSCGEVLRAAVSPEALLLKPNPGAFASATTTPTSFSLQYLQAIHKLPAALFFSVGVSTLSHPVPALVAFGLAMFLALFSGLKPAFMAKRLLAANFFFLLLWLLLPLAFFPRQGEAALFIVGPLSIYPSGFFMALLITLKGNAIVTALLALTGSSSLPENGQALRVLHVPDKLVTLLLITHANLALLADEYKRVFEAAQLRGFTPRTCLSSYATYARLVGLLLVRAWQRSQKVEQAMRLRGFAGRLPILSPCLPGRQRYAHKAGVLVLTSCSLASTGLLIWDISLQHSF